MAKIIFVWDKIIWEIVHSGKPFSGIWYASICSADSLELSALQIGQTNLQWKFLQPKCAHSHSQTIVYMYHNCCCNYLFSNHSPCFSYGLNIFTFNPITHYPITLLPY